jgi:hypothetical protein
MSDYRIEKVRRRVEIVLANGQRLDGDVFVPPLRRVESEREPLDLLNDDEPFLPLVLPSGDAFLIQKSHVAIVGTRLPEGDDAVERGLVGMHVEVTLIDGSSHAGSIFPEVRVNRQRLVDVLNDLSLPFLALFTTEQLRLVNRLHIAYVRPLS